MLLALAGKVSAVWTDLVTTRDKTGHPAKVRKVILAGESIVKVSQGTANVPFSYSLPKDTVSLTAEDALASLRAAKADPKDVAQYSAWLSAPTDGSARLVGPAKDAVERCNAALRAAIPPTDSAPLIIRKATAKATTATARTNR